MRSLQASQLVSLRGLPLFRFLLTICPRKFFRSFVNISVDDITVYGSTSINQVDQNLAPDLSSDIALTGGGGLLVTFNTTITKFVSFLHHWIKLEFSPVIMNGLTLNKDSCFLNDYWDSRSSQASNETHIHNPSLKIKENGRFIISLPKVLDSCNLYSYKSLIEPKIEDCSLSCPTITLTWGYELNSRVN